MENEISTPHVLVFVREEEEGIWRLLNEDDAIPTHPRNKAQTKAREAVEEAVKRDTAKQDQAGRYHAQQIGEDFLVVDANTAQRVHRTAEMKQVVNYS